MCTVTVNVDEAMLKEMPPTFLVSPSSAAEFKNWLICAFSRWNLKTQKP